MNDTINHPKHYNKGKIEVIDYIEDRTVDFCIGNVIKYVARAGSKGDAVEDLKKALFYINYRIKNGLDCVMCDTENCFYTAEEFAKDQSLSRNLTKVLVKIDRALWNGIMINYDERDIYILNAKDALKDEIKLLQCRGE